MKKRASKLNLNWRSTIIYWKVKSIDSNTYSMFRFCKRRQNRSMKKLIWSPLNSTKVVKVEISAFFSNLKVFKNETALISSLQEWLFTNSSEKSNQTNNRISKVLLNLETARTVVLFKIEGVVAKQSSPPLGFPHCSRHELISGPQVEAHLGSTCGQEEPIFYPGHQLRKIKIYISSATCGLLKSHGKRNHRLRSLKSL